MKREEQIRQARIEYTIKNTPIRIDDNAFLKIIDELNINHTFEEGAKWADKTMIEKACKWLEQHQEDYNVYDAWRGDYINLPSLIIDFRKAMKN